MATTIRCPRGAVINHRNVGLMSIQAKNFDRQQDDGSGNQPGKYLYRQKQDLYAVYTPFYMDSQAARIQRTEEIHAERSLEANGNRRDHKETSADRKRRKRKRPCLSEDESKISNDLRSCLPDLVTQAKQHRILCDVPRDILQGSDNNKTARVAASLPGCGDLFPDLCDDPNVLAVCEGETNLNIHHDVDPDFQPRHIINKCLHNDGDSGLPLTLAGHTFLIPPHSRFLTSSLSALVSRLHSALRVEDRYDLIVMDPPWTNKSVKRKKSYQSLLEQELCALPIQELAKPGCLITVWVTNNSRIDSYVKESLLPSWNVEYLTDWTWMKMTITGEPVLDLESKHKKPYERMIIGRVLPVDRSDITIDSTFAEGRQGLDSNRCSPSDRSSVPLILASDGAGVEGSQDSHQPTLPKDFVLVSVPCALHSKKPPLTDALQPYLPPSPKCLELFARNLLPGWSSWGNEPLRHQHIDFFEECCDEKAI